MLLSKSRPLLRLTERVGMALYRHHRHSVATADAGFQGELASYFYLRKLGFTVVARQWRTPQLRGEIDLIAWEGDTLCFIEVKTRSARGLVTAEAAVDEDKKRMLRRVAAAYKRQLPLHKGGLKLAEKAPCRFDVVSIYLDSMPDGMELIRNAFA